MATTPGPVTACVPVSSTVLTQVQSCGALSQRAMTVRIDELSSRVPSDEQGHTCRKAVE
jgi:hypothetical protein